MEELEGDEEGGALPNMYSARRGGGLLHGGLDALLTKSSEKIGADVSRGSG